MLRALAAALLLCLVAAGCGGTSAESVALKYARGFGGKDARVIRVERMRLAVNGAEDVVIIRGRFCGHGPATSGGCREALGLVQLTAGAHRFAGAALGVGPGTTRIDEARKARPGFSVFPDIRDLRVACRVPSAIAPGNLEGVCYSEPGPTGVSFIVGWPLRKPGTTRKHGGWIVRLAPDGKVLGITIHRHGPVDTWSTAYRDSLLRFAHRAARELGDPHPRRIRLRIGVPGAPAFNSPNDVVELWGDFACSPTSGCRPLAFSCNRFSACTGRGHYARLEIDWSSFGRLRGFQLLPKAPRATSR